MGTPRILIVIGIGIALMLLNTVLQIMPAVQSFTLERRRRGLRRAGLVNLLILASMVVYIILRK